jgi:hypothetical protein
VSGMVEDDINQMFPSNKVQFPVALLHLRQRNRQLLQVWDEQSRSWVFRPPPPAPVEKVAVNPSRSFFVPGIVQLFSDITRHLMFSIVMRILFRSLPAHRPQRIATCGNQELSRQKTRSD